MQHKAEELYKIRNSEKAFPRTESGIMKLLHELEVHRIELELQNEELQQARIKAEESEARLRELNAAKDKLFSIISHDLRSPFTSIIGFSNLLAERVSIDDHDGIVEYARIIRDSSWRVMELLMNLLEWSNSQTGKMDYYPEYIDLASMITEASALSTGGAQQKSISIMTDLPDNITAFADKAMISTILRNLISNAIKFTYLHGKIVISVKENHNGLLVSVSDNGVGLSKKRIENIFRFEKSKPTLGTQKEHGTGLGLLLCKEFVSKHGGRIWVESEFGKGSTFFFTIPAI
ncbi:MAG: HAMP domain-containing histidine kinase [Prolixibacteraceae bacterium]|nr:HAMP domain-containing histidine kinase [Prolixibacteraceae bacterium]